MRAGARGDPRLDARLGRRIASRLAPGTRGALGRAAAHRRRPHGGATRALTQRPRPLTVLKHPRSNSSHCERVQVRRVSVARVGEYPST